MKRRLVISIIMVVVLLALSNTVFADTKTIEYESDNLVYVQINDSFYLHNQTRSYQLSQGDNTVKILEQTGTNYRIVSSEVVYSEGEVDYLNEVMGIILDDQIIELSNTIVQSSKCSPELALYRFVIANVSYDKGSYRKALNGTYIADVSRTVETGKGLCVDYANLYASLMRAQGIPTKVVYGYTEFGYHAWNEVLIGGDWVSMDATMSDFNHDYDFGIDGSYIVTSSY